MAGSSWTSSVVSGTSAWLRSVFFIDHDIGIAVGDSGTILRTTNGGATWVARTSGTTEDLHAVSFADPDTGIAVGDEAAILRTTDGGRTWVMVSFR